MGRRGAAYEGLPQIAANANPVCLSRDYSLVTKDLHGLLRAEGRSNCVRRGELVTCAVLGGAKGAYEVSMRSPQLASVLIKRYDAERLYDVDLRRYIVLDELYAWQLMAVPLSCRMPRAARMSPRPSWRGRTARCRG